MVPIENESQWNTDDLTAIVNRITGGDRPSTFYAGTILLFRTNRTKVKTSKFSEDKEIPEAARHIGDDDGKFPNTHVVEIRSGEKLKMEVLDRLAHSGEEQDMSSEDVVRVVKEIAQALLGWEGGRRDLSWAKEMKLRFAGPGKRSKVAVGREVEGLRNEQQTIRRRAQRATTALEDKIEHLRKKYLEKED